MQFDLTFKHFLPVNLSYCVQICVCPYGRGVRGYIFSAKYTFFIDYYFIIQQIKNLLVPDMKPKTYLKITIIPDLYPFSSE